MKNFIGNQKVVLELTKIIKNKTFGHAYLFSGIDGIGKFILAKEFAKAILCLNSDDTYCGECESCRLFETSPDFVVVEKEDGLIKVDAIRQLIENVMLKPTVSTRRVFIIRDAECMNAQAQNALLKVLEEPPAYATIILTTSNKERIIKTIKSRCTTFDFCKLKNDEIQEIFKDEKISEDMLIYSNGSAGKYLKLKNSSYIDSVMILEQALSKNDLLSINRSINELKKVETIKDDINDVLDILIIKLGSNLLENTKIKTKQIEVIEEVRFNLSCNANFNISLDYLGLRLWEINNLA